MSPVPLAQHHDLSPRRTLARLTLPIRLVWRSMRWCARLCVGLALSALFTLLVAWLILHWGILPHIDRWRDDIEARASQALGVSVKLGRIVVRSSGWVPSVELGEVTLLDTRGEPALVLPRVTAAVSPQSLLRMELRFAQLVIEGPHLEIKREPSGRIVVAGIDAGSKPTGGADWFLSQTEFVIRGGSVRWLDEQRNLPPLLLSDVQLVMRNGLLRHDMRLDATPPVDWGERFSLRGRFTQPLLARAGQWERWSGQFYADFPRADVRALGQHVDLPIELSHGLGALRAWGRVNESQLESSIVDVALQGVQARFSPELDALHLQQVQGRFLTKRSGPSLRLEAQELSFYTSDGLSWPVSNVAVQLEQRGTAPASAGQLTANQLDLGVLVQVASRLPLGERVNTWLTSSAPSGQVRGLQLRWQGPLNDPQTYQVKAQLRSFTLASKPSANPMALGRPGVHNANLDLQANQSGGTASVNMDQGAVELPGVFSDPLVPLLRFSAAVNWKLEPVSGGPPKISVRWSKAAFANRDAQGELSGVWQTGPGTGLGKGQRFPGHLVLDGTLARGDLAQVGRYTPQVIPEAVRDYLTRALTQGQLSHGTVRVQGDLWDFPFAQARTPEEGVFRIAGRVAQATVAYAPSLPGSDDVPARSSPWPALTQVSGEVAIDRDQLQIRNAQAQVMGVTLRKINGQMTELTKPGRATLRVDGQGRGPVVGMLRFAQTTPVAGWTGGAVNGITAAGDGDLKLNLTIPVFDLPSSKVQGSVELAGNDVHWRPEWPVLTSVRGRLEFSNTGLSIANATARVLGGEVSFSGGTQPDRGVRISGQGQASAEALRTEQGLGPLSRLAAYFSGQTSYRFDLGLRGGRNEVNVSSNLVGWSSQLPAPMGKTSVTVWPMRFQTRGLSDPQSEAPVAADKPLQDSVQFHVGSLLQAHYVREWPADRSQSKPRIVRGVLGVGVPPPLMGASGVRARVNLPSVDMDAWEDVHSQVLGGGTPASQAATGLGSYAPTQMEITADAVTSGSLRLSDLHAQARLEGDEWYATLMAQQINGELVWRPSTALRAGHLQARLSRLAMESADVTGPRLARRSRARVPSFDVVVDDFELRGKSLGRLEVLADHAGGGAVDWRLQRLSLTTPEAKLSASGRWAAVAGLTPLASTSLQTQMDFKLQISDAGALLDRLGLAKALRAGRGELTGQLRWNDSPLNPDPLSMSGDMAVELSSGQFLKVDPGAARLLGVLSLQSLPRRLLLDFRDVFQAGFVFDNIDGNVSMNQGVAATNNLRIRGIQAAVLMEGTASLIDETQDLRVIVLPDLNAGTASLAYAVINPALGLGTFLAQLFLRKSLNEANTREFHVTGSWTDPKYTRIQRGSAGAAASEEPDPPAASAPNKP